MNIWHNSRWVQTPEEFELILEPLFQMITNQVRPIVADILKDCRMSKSPVNRLDPLTPIEIPDSDIPWLPKTLEEERASEC